MLTNTEYFSEAANYFRKHRQYDCGVPGTSEFMQWWREEQHRSIEGYSVGDTRVSGYHYWFLNFCPIMKTPDTYGVIHKDKPTHERKVDKISDFPVFWDFQHDFYNYIDKAELLGMHASVIKARGKGFSYMLGSMGDRNYFLIPNSKTFYTAFLKDYLFDDGIVAKCWAYMSFIDSNTAWSKRRQYKNADDHRRASKQVITGGVTSEGGYMSEIIALSLKDNPDKIRGKRGKLTVFEEGGSFPGLLKAWQLSRKANEQGKFVSGIQVAFGTGGSEKGTDFDGLESLFYDCEANNILELDNVWDDGAEEEKCAYFVHRSVGTDGCADENGNSNLKAAEKEVYLPDEEKARNSKDPDSLARYMAENPKCPQDALLNVGTNVFSPIIPEVKAWKARLENTGVYRNLGVPGIMVTTDKGTRFKPNLDLAPIYKYPHTGLSDLDGCVVQYFAPFRIDGVIPPHLYIICHDPYADENAEDTTSLGATYVIMNTNNFAPSGDRIVASYVGRPGSLDEYNRIIFQLAVYYNAEIGFEADRGTVVDYAKRFKKLDWLAEEFELGFEEKLSRKAGSTRKFSMKIGSGKDNLKVKFGDLYLRDWFATVRGIDEDGNELLNLHTVYDPAVLAEILKYRPGKNVDRLSALRIGMYHMRELAYNEQVAIKPSKTRKKTFWNTRHFSGGHNSQRSFRRSA